MKKYNLFFSGPLITVPMQIGAVQYLSEKNIQFDHIYASNAGILTALLVASGYNVNMELLKAIKSLSSTNVSKLNWKTLGLTKSTKSLNKIQESLDKYIVKAPKDLKYPLTVYFHDIERNSRIEINKFSGKPISLFAPLELLKEPVVIMKRKCISAETMPIFFYDLNLPDNTIHLRGQVDGAIKQKDVFGKTKNGIEALSSFQHLPTELAQKTMFLHSKQADSLKSFWMLPATTIESLVQEGYDSAKKQYIKMLAIKD